MQDMPQARGPVVTTPTARRNPGGRPAIGPQVNIAMAPDMLAQVDATAAQDGVSRAEWIRRAVTAALKVAGTGT